MSSLHTFGHTEDGEAYTAPVYYVVAQDGFGFRWVHFATFAACAPEVNHEDGIMHFKNISAEAQRNAGHLLERIKDSGEIDLDNHWTETRPEYGSRAFIENGDQYE